MEREPLLPTLKSLLVDPEVPVIHRDLSWLQFNERVLDEAEDRANPLLERAKFLSITASNLDEFFMIRFASLAKSLSAQQKLWDPKKIARLSRVRASLLESVAKFGSKQEAALNHLAHELKAHGVDFYSAAPEDGSAHAELGRELFETQVLPKLTAPEYFTASLLQSLENLQLVAVLDAGHCVRIPRSIPAVLWVKIGEEVGARVVAFFLDGLLAQYLPSTFRLPGPVGFLRVTRDGDVEMDIEEEDPESVPDAVRKSLSGRDRGRVMRLQYHGAFPREFLQTCCKVLKLHPGQLLPAPGTLGLNGIWSAVNAFGKELAPSRALSYPPLQAMVPRTLQDHAKIFEALREKDYLLHHPYDSFDAYVSWMVAACRDPQVKSIQQTVYRIDAVSPVIAALKEAAAAGKKVRVVIELRARFDELNNLRLAEELRKAGVEVCFGVGGLKLHAKVALVEREEDGAIRTYSHLSTGNYNATTARAYTDLAILTANPEIGADARLFFDSVFKGEAPTQFKRLVPAPGRLHRRLLSHIKEETKAAASGKGGRIVAKVNALVDPGLIEHLYQASQAGVKVDLIVRGACSLVPGVKGLSENIRVVSVVDRFLEHSRIYYFQSARAMYLSSADWMPRNFFSRLEIAFPVLDARIFEYIEKIIIPTYVSDRAKARRLTPQGTWVRRAGAAEPSVLRSQFFFEALAERDYAGTPLGRIKVYASPENLAAPLTPGERPVTSSA